MGNPGGESPGPGSTRFTAVVTLKRELFPASVPPPEILEPTRRSKRIKYTAACPDIPTRENRKNAGASWPSWRRNSRISKSKWKGRLSGHVQKYITAGHHTDQRTRTDHFLAYGDSRGHLRQNS